MSHATETRIKHLIAQKHAQTNHKPTYATRKLSIGLVSCMLGYMMSMYPAVALADTTSPANRDNTISTDAHPTSHVATSPDAPHNNTDDTDNNERSYAADEAKIKDANSNERYRTTEMPQGKGTGKELYAHHMGNEIEGFSFSEISPTAKDKDKKHSSLK